MMQPGIFMEPGTARLYHIIRRNAMISGTKSDGFISKFPDDCIFRYNLL